MSVAGEMIAAGNITVTGVRNLVRIATLITTVLTVGVGTMVITIAGSARTVTVAVAEVAMKAMDKARIEAVVEMGTRMFKTDYQWLERTNV